MELHRVILADLDSSAPVTQAFGRFRRSTAATALFLLTAAFLLRWPGLGNPAYHLDEQYYLLVGDRMLRGAIPYVYLWDRKPVGLFLIYAGIRALGGAGIIQYQLVATLFAAATAFAVSRIARLRSGEDGALLAGLAYLLWMLLMSGGGGQSPVFYNFPVAIAGWCVLRALDANEARAILRLGAAAMALCGVAILIKTSVLFEGAALGLTLLWALRSRGASLAGIAAAATLFGMLALAPTAIAGLAYAASGHFEAFRFANVTSILLKHPESFGRSARIADAARLLGPLLGIAALSLWRERQHTGFFAIWLAAALAGFLVLGNFYDHYALPLLVPLAAASAALFARRPLGPLVFAALALPAFVLAPGEAERTERDRTELAALAAAVPPAVDTGCLLVFDGPPILYLARNACVVTSFVFPDHLSAAAEDGAIGVRPALAVSRAMARHPQAVVIGAQPLAGRSNLASRATLEAALARDYELIARRPFGGRMLLVYGRR